MMQSPSGRKIVVEDHFISKSFMHHNTEIGFYFVEAALEDVKIV